MTTRSQCDRILRHLKRRPLTRAQAMDDLGIANVTARIAELRQEGYAIRDEWKTQRNRFADLTKFKVSFMA